MNLRMYFINPALCFSTIAAGMMSAQSQPSRESKQKEINNNHRDNKIKFMDFITPPNLIVVTEVT